MSAPAGPQPEGYAAVRAALRERGYLETPLERLFLGGIGDPLTGSWRGRMISALLAGLLGGVLLGILLAAVLVFGGRGLVPAWPDGVLYAILFAPVLGVIVALTEAAAGLVIRAVGRVRPGLSPRTASLAAGLSVAAVLSIYLGSWWAGSSGTLTLRDLLGLAALAAGAGFAGRVVSAAALVQTSLLLGRAPLRHRPRTAAIIGALATAAICLAAAVAAWTDRGPATATAPVPVSGVRPRALFVAWDGLGLELATGAGRVLGPNEGAFLRRALAAGTRPVVPVRPWDPVVGWTTIATGCPPAVHGVPGTSLPGLRGAASPLPQGGLAAGPLELLSRLWPTRGRVVRSGVRRVPAFWEVAATGGRTAVVGWWGTWPAAAPGPAGGYVVSDGALAALHHGRGLDEAIYPPGWGSTRGPEWLAAAERAAGPIQGATAPTAIAREARIIDLFAIAALDDALADPGVRVATVYLPGLDILRERFRQQGRDPFETLDAIREHVSAIDAALYGTLARRETADLPHITWLVGMPGRAGDGESGFAARLPSVAGWGSGDAPIAATALAPSWLADAGLPVDDRMAGRPVAPWERAARIRTPAAPAAGSRPAEGLEEDFQERLKSLGYVK